jgi:hypothetical protein
MSTRDSELEADTLDMLALEPSNAAFTFGPFGQHPVASEEDRILDADEIAAELVSDFDVRFLPPTPAQRRASAAAKCPPQSVSTALPPLAATPLSRAHSEITLQSTAARPPQPTAAAMDLEAAHEEIARLQTQMRARDAYLGELERALDARTRELQASGIGSVEDAYRLLGRVRGQAFRIAELESELRQAQHAPARLSQTPAAIREKSARSKPRAPRTARSR